MSEDLREAGPEPVRIEREVYGGSGLARTATGAVRFVPFTLPGEEVEISAATSGNEAKLLRVLASAPDRTQPPCPHFGVCGGCHYQHAVYSSQLGMKRAILTETLQRAGIADAPELETHAGEPWQYRNRIRLRLQRVGGELRVGYSVRGTNEFLPIVECPIASPTLLRSALALLQLANENAEARVWADGVKEVEFFADESSARLTMTMSMVTMNTLRQGSFARLCEAMRLKVPELTGAGAALAEPNRREKPRTESWGAAGLAYRAAGETYWITRGGFFQVNRFLVDTLVSLVCDERKGTLAWDLYAGVGLFSRVLARSFAQVTAVEANPIAVADLRSALGKLGPQHRAVQAATLTFLEEAVLQRERPQLIVLDPPRAGAGLKVCELLLRLGAAEMVYVSCDPTTLARDLAALQRGYSIHAVNLIDLFPQTFHIETVVVLRRK